MNAILAQAITDDPSKFIGLAKTISEQSLASILVLVVLIFIASMAFLVWYFVKQGEKSNDITRGIAQKYSEDAASSTNAINNMNNSLKENTTAMRENTNVMQRFRDKLPALIVPILICVGLLVGCASTPPEKIVRFAAVAKSVAFEGAHEWIAEKLQHKETIKLIIDQLDISIKSKQFTPARLRSILKPLNIRELSSREGRIGVGATIVIWDGLVLAGVIGDTSNLEPVFAGIRDGFQAAVDLTE